MHWIKEKNKSLNEGNLIKLADLFQIEKYSLCILHDFSEREFFFDLALIKYFRGKNPIMPKLNGLRT